MTKRYRHCEGTIYEVLATVRHMETKEFLVVYKAWRDPNLFSNVSPDASLWACPRASFYGQVEVEGEMVPRFALLEEDSP